MVYIYLFPGLQRYMEYCLSGPDSVLPEDYTPLDTMYPATGPIPSKTLDIVLYGRFKPIPACVPFSFKPNM